MCSIDESPFATRSSSTSASARSMPAFRQGHYPTITDIAICARRGYLEAAARATARAERRGRKRGCGSRSTSGKRIAFVSYGFATMR